MNLLPDLQLSSTGGVELLRAPNSKKVTKSLYSEGGGKRSTNKNLSITRISSRILPLVQKKIFKTNPNPNQKSDHFSQDPKNTMAEYVIAAAHVA